MKFVGFSADGHMHQEQSLPVRAQVRPTFLAKVGANYVTYFRQPTVTHAKEVLHVFSPGLDRKLASFGDMDEIWDPEVDAQRAIAGNPRGARATVWEEAVCITSYIYDGTITCYQHESGAWTMRRFQGEAPKESHLVHPRPKSGLPMRGDWLISGQEGRFDISIFSSSRGFAATEDYLAHFTIRGDRRAKRLYVEVFDHAGELIRFGEVSNYEPFDENERAVFEVLCASPDGKIYLTDMRDGYAVIKFGWSIRRNAGRSTTSPGAFQTQSPPPRT